MQTGGLRTKGIQKTSQQDKPLITVVTVVFNGVATLEQTIQSVVNQTYGNVEYIIIDGASTDGTLDIVKKYEDKIDYWQSEPDKGIYDAMNKGIGLANGLLINMMNSGDLLVKNVLEIIVQAHLKNPDAVLYGMYEKIKNGKFSGCGPSDLFPLAMACHQTIFIPAKYHKMYGNYDIKLKIAADYKFFHVLEKNGVPFQFLHCLIALYDDTGISSNYLQRQKEFVKVQKELGNQISPFAYQWIAIKFYIKKIFFSGSK